MSQTDLSLPAHDTIDRHSTAVDTTSASRVTSLQRRPAVDMLRGYCLWNAFLMELIVAAFKPLPSSGLKNFIARHYTHAQWHGIVYYDFGYPVFIMLLAASMLLSYQRRREAGMSNWQFFVKIVLVRSLLLWIFAFFLYGGFSKPVTTMPFNHVFFQLSGCIFLSGLAAVLLSFRVQIAALVLVLLGQWAVMATIDVPEYGRGDYSKEGNADTYLLARLTDLSQKYVASEEYDYTRRHLISFCLDLPKIFGSCLIGLIMGQILLSRTTVQKQVLIFVLVGLIACGLALLWNRSFPINKRIWTSSYTLISGGVGCLHLALCMQLVEVWKLRFLGFPFEVFGRYPLAAWACFHLLPFENFAQRLIGPGFPPIFGQYHQVAIAVMQVFLCWLLFVIWQKSARGQRRNEPATAYVSEGNLQASSV